MNGAGEFDVDAPLKQTISGSLPVVHNTITSSLVALKPNTCCYNNGVEFEKGVDIRIRVNLLPEHQNGEN
jgi:hypothetical protein